MKLLNLSERGLENHNFLKRISVLFLFMLFLPMVFAQICNDTDNGIDFFNFGKVFLGDFDTTESICNNDTCNGNVLFEAYCNSYGNIDWVAQNCSELGLSCINGNCVNKSLIETEVSLNK